MDYQQIAWLVFCVVAVLMVQGFSLIWVAAHLGVKNVSFFGGLGALIVSGIAGFAVWWILGLLEIDPFIAAVPGFLAYLGVFSLLLRAKFARAAGVWFLSQLLAALGLGLLALAAYAVVTFPEVGKWGFVGIVALAGSAASLVWAAHSSDVDMQFGEALVTMLVSGFSVAVWWIVGYYVLGFSYWVVIPPMLVIHFLIVKLRLDVGFGRALLVIACTAIVAVALTSLLGLAALGMAIPYFRDIVWGPNV